MMASKSLGRSVRLGWLGVAWLSAACGNASSPPLLAAPASGASSGAQSVASGGQSNGGTSNGNGGASSAGVAGGESAGGTAVSGAGGGSTTGAGGSSGAAAGGANGSGGASAGSGGRAGTAGSSGVAVCGDALLEAGESCDDGNTVSFDGCSATCQTEPTCTNAGCTSVCGDGIVLGANEQCDDGNLQNGDGCSDTCQIEPGATCIDDGSACAAKVGGVCTVTLSATYRDLDPATNIDFEPALGNQTAIVGLVANGAASDGRPVLANPSSGNGSIHSAASFNQWFHDAAPTNATFAGNLVLFQAGVSNTYVNRWGQNGEQWPAYSNVTYCANGNPGQTCALCTLTAGQVCLDPCTAWGNTQICTADVTLLDGNPVFFPIDNLPGLVGGTRSTATIAPIYGGDYNAEPGGALHNFDFTTELRFWFKYQPSDLAALDIVGDDDTWVFVNRRLAIDLGGWHPPIETKINLDATAATAYALTPGALYEVAIFRAERKVTTSSLTVSLSGFKLAPSVCTKG